MRLRFLLFTLVILPLVVQAQGPEVTSWVINTTGATGYNGIASNVQTVQYSTNNVYITCTCIPGYDIGPWVGNPNIPANQNFLFKITRNPTENTGNLTAVPLGHIGVWSNGVSIYNAKDGRTYNNQGVWNYNAYYSEGSTFDDCVGHAAQNGEYHHHISPACLYDETDSLNHSPIIGYAFDGFPIYGAYGYANTNGTGGIKRMTPSIRTRNIASRTTLPDGSTASQPGPTVGAQFPLGYFLEDYEYVAASGDLDDHNGRFCVTPEYPAGIYAYFVTIDANLQPVYPYTLATYYYGTVQAGNTGPGSGHNTVSETVVTYTPTTATPDALTHPLSFGPNPATDVLRIDLGTAAHPYTQVAILNAQGQTVQTVDIQNVADTQVSVSSLAAGLYYLRFTPADGQAEQTFRFLKP